ncbi:MAG: hypothetical protein DMF60_15455, partial [Acidobacteria bacterium]
MNCHDLEEIVNDLARGQMMEASLREKALAHAESCAGCAMRLEDERSLTAGLRGVAAATAAEQAPHLVESALLTAFREQHLVKHAPVFAGARYSAQRWAYVAVGAAAVAVIVMLLWLGGSRSKVLQPAVPEKAAGADRAVPPTHENRPAAPEPALSPGTDGTKLAVDRRPARVKGVPRPMRTASQSNRAVNKPAESNSDAEIATDFIPLMNRESLAQLDSGQIMRVELPRSALMSYGLPMNMERADERIKADVLV